ncbi:hypothetical protein BBD42_28580 [Paenibacillus sp. BIHB 4019]|uniref:Nucleotide-diphospho-sugar transferase domain-containing protein n=1 Tax=Paenibacillus sp. BIHB 4019 TaxID=1870819 RepID=A0A1B2DQP1_9BACL|nr:hypothetical protein [Paenibacillus sp. BIHB 4019]ANY70017.1 hypothetical protein BBD42_28580 [Paenibacillus sp. BIHB 4019]
MIFNVMTVLNSDYFDFGKLFVNSFYDNVDLSRIHKLYVYDTGLSEDDKKYLSVFPQMEIVSTELNTKHVLLHDEDWRKNVYSKTAFLLQVIEKDSLPTVMIDSDCLFLADFTRLIPEDVDFVACRREEQEAFCEYIASFFVINSIAKAPAFIREWREEMYYGTENHKESPALSRLINKGSYQVYAIKEDLVSYTGIELTADVTIAHMKSTRGLRTVEQRVSQPHLKAYKDKYLTKIPLAAVGEAFEAMFRETAAEAAPEQGAGKERVSALDSISPEKRALLLKRLKKG